MGNAFKTGEYDNLFKLIGKTDADVDARLQKIWDTFFYGSEDDRIYHPAGDDMGYLEDTGNHDARTEHGSRDPLRALSRRSGPRRGVRKGLRRGCKGAPRRDLNPCPRGIR